MLNELNESAKKAVRDLIVEALRDDCSIESEVCTDLHGFKCVKARSFASEVRVYMEINMSPCLVAQLESNQ